MTGVALGLLAAVSWALTDSLAALSSRRLGALPSAAFSLLVSLAVLGSASVVAGTIGIGPVDEMLHVALFGAVATVSSLALWQSLRLAPLAVISPINATVGVATVALAMLLLGERPAPIQLVAVPIAAAGSLLTALVPGVGDRRPSLMGGAMLAFVAVLGFALIGVGLRDPIRELGWLPVATVSRATNAGLTWLILLAVLALPAIRGRAGLPPSGGPDGSDDRLLSDPRARLRALAPAGVVTLVLALGLVDVSGLIFFAAGLEVAPAWLIGLLASMGPVLGIAVGLVAFGERLRASQWLGVIFVGVALVLVAVGEAVAPSGPV